MNQMEQANFCAKCNFEGGAHLRFCQQCGAPMQSRQQIRMLGWVLTAIGGGLALFTLFLSSFMAEAMWNTGRPGGHTSFTGGPGMALVIGMVMLLLLAFGATSIWAGLFQVRHGRRNPRVLAVMLALVGAFIFVGGALMVVN